MKTKTPVLVISALSLLLAACGGDSPAEEDPDGAVAAAPEVESDEADADADPVEATPDPAATEADPADDERDDATEQTGDEETGEATAYVIATTPPEPRTELAPGTVVVQQVQDDGATAFYVVLSANPDGTIVENWRFTVAMATAGQDPAHNTRFPGPGAFSSDFTQVVGTAQFRLDPIGFDTQIGYFAPDGTFTNLSGRDEPTSGVGQSHPAFAPDDRIWYWQQAPGATMELWSVAIDGSDRRQEDPGLTYPGQEFSFTQGGHPVPVYVEQQHSAVADDGSLAVSEDYNGWRAGSDLATLEDAPQLAPDPTSTATPGGTARPVAFLPGSTDRVLCVSGQAFVCELDVAGGTYAVSTGLLPDPQELQGEAHGARLLPDGTAAWFTYNSWQVDGTDVARLVWMDPADGSLVGTAALAYEDWNLPSPQVVGFAE